ILFIIWIAIGVWMYRDAEKRGKSGALWLIIGLLFGIIGLGLIIWLIVRPPEPSFYEKKAAGEEKKERICPSCGRSIPFDAKVCPYCGKNFEE
ncbi:MAG: zinc ribbon domain-containing protein, partial [Thermoplasmata archaeon]